MIGFQFAATLADADGKVSRPFHASVSAPHRRGDGRFECRLDCSEPEMSRVVVSEYSELAYMRALNRVRYSLIDRGQGVFDTAGRPLWFDPPVRYPARHGGFAGPRRGRWRAAFPPVAFVGRLVAADGSERPYAIRIGSPIRSERWFRYSCGLFIASGVPNRRLADDWPDQAYAHAFQIARMELAWVGGTFIDSAGRPLQVTAPVRE